ncbi:hypothetical protein K435DRAFT_876459 [Dendrothele bispora CBS 962.96]|uniref:Uncharacterized protein n=1 Tax=Dendrothele bispora (strain CBS 962.96) TaxID=1314807 RepID=A0A4S8KT70_DENBC|nr:hypothetical protein K435DRAFT_876459 [Dendrothele bispora CBS 962.96]
MARINDATRIWELNLYWAMYSHCSTWNDVCKAVDVWECVREHHSVPGTQPPNSAYWRHVARR